MSHRKNKCSYHIDLDKIVILTMYYTILEYNKNNSILLLFIIFVPRNENKYFKTYEQ